MPDAWWKQSIANLERFWGQPKFHSRYTVLRNKLEAFQRRSEKFKKELKFFNILKNDEILNGLILGDAHLQNIRNGENSHIEMEQSDKHESLVIALEKHLNQLGINTNTYRYLHKNTNTWGVRVYAYRSLAFTFLRRYWYDDRQKIVPKDMVLTPKTLAYWFMADGTCTWHNVKKDKSTLSIMTQGFRNDDIDILIRKLNNLGIKMHKQKIKGMTTTSILTMSKSSTVEKFLNTVEPYIIPEFNYKIKHPIVRNYKEAANSPERKKQMSEEMTKQWKSTKRRNQLLKQTRGENGRYTK